MLKRLIERSAGINLNFELIRYIVFQKIKVQQYCGRFSTEYYSIVGTNTQSGKYYKIENKHEVVNYFGFFLNPFNEPFLIIVFFYIYKTDFTKIKLRL